MPTRIATWNPARGVWETTVQNVICGHSVPFSETWPISGSMLDGVAYERPMLERLTSDSASSLLPTPMANEGAKASNRMGVAAKLATGKQVYLTNVLHDIELLPTPTVSTARGAGRHGEWSANLQTVLLELSGGGAEPQSSGGSALWDEPLPLPELMAELTPGSLSG